MSNNYPLDLTGVSSTNKVPSETVILNSNIVNRAFAPINGPFFKESMVIIDNANGAALTSDQWSPFFLVQSATYKSEQEVYALGIIKDASVSNSLTISYQSIGAGYIGDYSSIVSLVNIAIGDSRSVNWDNILNHVIRYNAAIKAQSINQLTDMDLLLISIEKLSQVALLGDTISQEGVYAYVDKLVSSYALIAAALAAPGNPLGDHINAKNAHGYTAADFGLGNVQNYGVASDNDVITGTATSAYVLLSNAKALIQSALSGGINPHILNKSNPHGLTAEQIDLGNVANYDTAVIGDLNTPDSTNPKYVTSDVLAQWLSTYATTIATTYANDKITFMNNVNAALNNANSAATSCGAALAQANALSTTVNDLSTQVATLTTEINNLMTNAANQTTAATSLISRYLTPAITAARNEGYSAGFIAGSSITINNSNSGNGNTGNTTTTITNYGYSDLINYFGQLFTNWFTSLPTTLPTGSGIPYNNNGILAFTAGAMAIDSASLALLATTTLDSLINNYVYLTTGSGSIGANLSKANLMSLFSMFMSSWFITLTTTTPNTASTFYNNGQTLSMTAGANAFTNSQIAALGTQMLSALVSSYGNLLNSWYNTLPTQLPSTKGTVYNNNGIMSIST